MEDFNEDITNILIAIKSKYKGCRGQMCFSCPLSGALAGSIEHRLCVTMIELGRRKC